MEEKETPAPSRIDAPTPQVLLAGLRSERADDVSLSTDKEGAPLRGANFGQDGDDFLWHVHAYVNEYIRFADAKAGFLVALTSATLWVLFSANLSTLLGGTPWGWAARFGAAALLFLSISLICSMIVVFPRMDSHPGEGLLFWNAIAEHKTAAAFKRAVEGLSPSARTAQISTHLHSLAKVAKQKYRWVNYAVISGVVGLVSGVLTQLLQ